MLRDLDLIDIGKPIENTKRYLVARYNERFLRNPKKCEEIVGGDFSDFGYEVRVTAYSSDKGLDVVLLEGNGNYIVGVQVKRWRGNIGAAQIRALAGALVLDRMMQGVLVTTSTFISGAYETAEEFRQQGIEISL